MSILIQNFPKNHTAFAKIFATSLDNSKKYWYNVCNCKIVKKFKIVKRSKKYYEHF